MADSAHIVILARHGGRWIGGQQYWLNLTKALLLAKQFGSDIDVSVLVDDSRQLSLYHALRPSLRVCDEIESRLKPSTLANRLIWRLTRVGGRTQNARLDRSLKDIGATFAYPLRSRRFNSADWIPDFQYRHFPQGAGAEEVRARRLECLSTVSYAQRIVLSSRAAERDCHELFPESVGRTKVLSFRVFVDPSLLNQDPAEVVRLYNLRSRFLLVSNLLAPTKNHMIVLEALAAMSPFERRSVQVVFTGDIFDYRNPGFYNSFFARIHQLGLSESVVVLGLIPKIDQIQLLRASLASLQPSLFEGWHTGVEEARLLGKRILLSTIPVHFEQSPPHAEYFDPRNPDELARIILALFSDPNADGFDADAEKNAVFEYRTLQLAYAREFVAIAANPP